MHLRSLTEEAFVRATHASLWRALATSESDICQCRLSRANNVGGYARIGADAEPLEMVCFCEHDGAMEMVCAAKGELQWGSQTTSEKPGAQPQRIRRAAA